MDPTVDSSQPDGSMTTSDESLQQEVRSVKDSLLGPKAKIRIGAWNVRTMYETSKSAQVISEMTVMTELTEMGLTWGEAQHVAQDRSRWRKTVAALCPTGDEED